VTGQNYAASEHQGQGCIRQENPVILCSAYSLVVHHWLLNSFMFGGHT
jgi:hypothetical protein